MNFICKSFACVTLPTLFFTMRLQALEIGDSIPKSVLDTKLHDVSGKDFTLKGIQGKKGTLVIFGCNHCPFVVDWNDRIVKNANKYSKEGFGVIEINSDDPAQHSEDSYEEMVKVSKKLGMMYPYAVDATSEVAIAFGAQKTPDAYLFNSKGKLVYKGAIDGDSKNPQTKKTFLADALDAVKNNKTVPLAYAPAVGCSIPYYKTTKK